MYELIEYIEELIKTKVETLKDVWEIKNSLNNTGKDIAKIFEKPFEKTKVFDISSILVVIFITEILNENKINMSDEEYNQLTQDVSFDEKDVFEKYIEECKEFFENYENRENCEEVEVYEEEKSDKDMTTNASSDNNVIEDNEHDNNEHKGDENNGKGKKKEETEINETKDNEKNKDKQIKNDNGENQDDYIIEEIMDNKKKIKKNNKENNNIKNSNENKIDNYSNIEDLIKYINGTDKKKKRKKRRRKKAKVNKNKIKEEEEKEKEMENNALEKDDVYENFKINIINFTKNLEKIKKIKPVISEAFLEKLKAMN